jgi:ribonuclease P protein subunit RPR2
MKNRPAKRNYGKMRSTVATIARERIDILLDQAKEYLPRNPDLSERYVELARKISTRTKVRIPREKKHYFCKNCGQPLVLGKNARVRLRSGNSRIIITCLNCGTLRRYPFTKPS